VLQELVQNTLKSKREHDPEGEECSNKKQRLLIAPVEGSAVVAQAPLGPLQHNMSLPKTLTPGLVQHNVQTPQLNFALSNPSSVPGVDATAYSHWLNAANNSGTVQVNQYHGGINYIVQHLHQGQVDLPALLHKPRSGLV
jgi:hypothetical protein